MFRVTHNCKGILYAVLIIMKEQAGPYYSDRNMLGYGVFSYPTCCFTHWQLHDDHYLLIRAQNTVDLDLAEMEVYVLVS